MNKEILGIDIGGVLAEEGAKSWRSASQDHLNIPAIEGAFSAIRRLREEKFGDDIHVISKASSRVQLKALEWLDHNRFFELTGVPRQHLHFCFDWDGKAPICATLKVTHFVDDRMRILSTLSEVENLFLFRGRKEEKKPFADFLPLVNEVSSWDELVKILLP